MRNYLRFIVYIALALVASLLIGPHVIKLDPFFDHFCAFVGSYFVIAFFGRLICFSAESAQEQQQG